MAARECPSKRPPEDRPNCAAAVAQGIGINKSLHWLKVAVHDLAGKRTPQLRNSALTR